VSQVAKTSLTIFLWAVLAGLGLAGYQAYHWITYGSFEPIGILDAAIDLVGQGADAVRAGAAVFCEWLLSRPIAGMIALIPAAAIALIVTSSLRPRV
jgi:hypothetical protein